MVKSRKIKTPKRGPATPGNDAQPGPVKTPRTVKTPKQTPRKRALEGEPSEEIPAKTPKGRKSMSQVLKKEESESESDTEVQQISLELSQTEDSSQESPDDEVAESNEESPVVKPSKPKIVSAAPKQRQEVPTILVRNLRFTISEVVLRQHFHECGEIIGCTIIADKNAANKKIAFIKFKDLESARCAEGSQNGKFLQGFPINVQLMKVKYHFTGENTVRLNGLPVDTSQPTNVDRDKLGNKVQKAMAVFGRVEIVKITKDMQAANVLFENNAAVVKALEAGSIEITGTTVKIVAFVDGITQIPEAIIVLYGLAEDTNTEDIEEEVSKYTEVVTIRFPQDKEDKVMKHLAFVHIKTAADVDKLLNMNTLNVKDTLVQVLPYPKTKQFFDRDTHLFYRHPAGVFVENLSSDIQRTDIQKAVSKFGLVHKVFKPHSAYAAVFFEHAEAAQKVLQEEQIVVKDTVLTLHAIDGSYVPNTGKFAVGSTLYFSNLDNVRDIPELKMKLKSLKMTLGYSLLKRCPLTGFFDHGVYIDVCNEANAKQLLDLQLTVNNKEVHIEMYDPAKHVISGMDCMVCIESIDEDVTEIVLWKAFQTFGKVSKTAVLRKLGYILFASKEAADQALAALNVTIKGKELKIVKPTNEMWEQFRTTLRTPVFKPKTFKGPSLSKFSGKFKGMQHQTTFKKKTFKKGGFKTPRRYL